MRRNEEFDRFLRRNIELRNAYIAYLAREDILAYLMGKLRLDSLEDWWSEKELARMENREIQEKPLFLNQRLHEIFPRFASMEFLFTGMLMDTLLWKKREVKRKPIFPMEKDGFRVSLV